jgi:hypothetical protein
MKIRFLTVVLFLLSFFTMKAQEKLSVDLNIKTESADKINFNQTSIGITFDKELSPKIDLTNKLKYSNLNIKYDLGSFTSFENLDQFNQLQYEFGISHQITNSAKLNFSMTPTANFQRNITFSDLSLLGNIEVNLQLNPNTNINIGVARATVFGSPKFIPTLAIAYKVNNTSSLLIGFPDSKISYANNIRNKFSLSNSFNGNFYHLDTEVNLPTTPTKVNISQMTSAFEYERNVDKNWFMNFNVGSDFNKKYHLVEGHDHELYDFNIPKGYVLGIGIKYKQ